MALGWQGVKLYFMIGLPTETDLDIDAIIDLAGRLSRIRAPKGWKGVTISVSTFVPKAHTPFQWCEQISLEESRQKIARLKTAMRKRRIRFKWQNPEMSLLEGIWARGDRKLTPLLLRAYERNCRFDGWSDRFDLSRWKKAMADVGVDVEACLGARGMNDPLPWDHIDSGVSKQFLQNEWGKALSLSLTPDCRHDDVCHRCGVCDFKTIRPVIHRHVEEDDTQVSAQDVCRFSDYVKRVLFYQKVGPARFFGHLELARIFERAFRRARIPVRYSQGFHPSPKLSFDTALPVGMESKEERLSVEVPPAFTDPQVTDRLNESLPPGLRITECLPAESAVSTARAPLEWYVVTLRHGRFRTDLLKSFENCGTWIRKKVNRKGRVSRVDLKQLVSRVVLSSPQQCELTLDGSYTPRLRVPHILQEIFNLSETTVKLARIEKQAVRDGI
jgi:radical SAM-linked protein